MNSANTKFPKMNMDYRELPKPYLKNWKWFLASVIIALVLGFLKIRYTIPEYAVEAKIQILEDQGSKSELDVFRDLDVFGQGSNNIDDEIEILNSRSNLIRIVKQLGLNKKIIALGKILDSDMYVNPPFNVSFIAHDSVVHNARADFFITMKSSTNFEIIKRKVNQVMCNLTEKPFLPRLVK